MKRFAGMYFARSGCCCCARNLEDRLARKEWKLEWADVIRNLDNLMEMAVAISGKGYVFRGQISGVAGKAFQACGVALPPALRSASVRLRWRESVSLGRFQNCNQPGMNNFRRQGVEDELRINLLSPLS